MDEYSRYITEPVGWKELTSTEAIPGTRSAHTLVANPRTSELYLFGGYNGKECVDTLHVLSLNEFNTSAVWTEIDPAREDPNRPSPRASHCACTCGDLGMFVFGGLGSGYQVIHNDAFFFDYATRKWTNLSQTNRQKNARLSLEDEERLPYGHGAEHMQAFVPVEQPEPAYGSACTYDPVHNCVFVFGGTSGPQNFSNKLLVFDLHNKRWWTLKEGYGQGPSPRYLSKVAWVNDKILIFGGGVPRTCYSQQPMEVYELDLSTLVWSDLVYKSGQKAPGSRIAFGFTDLGGRGMFLIHGGLARSKNPGDQLADENTIGENIRGYLDKVMYEDAWVFDSNTRTWSECEIAMERGDAYAHLDFHALASVSDGNDVVLYGGFDRGNRSSRAERLRFKVRIPTLEDICYSMMDMGDVGDEDVYMEGEEED